MAPSDVIDWKGSSSQILLNPRIPLEDRNRVISSLPRLEGHIWITTSGSSGKLKPVALSKEALLLSAEAVNRHLDSHSDDIWLNALPIFHVGGLGIVARAEKSGAKVVDYQEAWEASRFVSQVAAARASLTSLVPTQVYDLVMLNCKSPESLRTVVVGGGALEKSLYTRAKELGWKLLPSYGLTECCSQIATAPLSSLNGDEYPLLQPLSHVELDQAAEWILKIRSRSLLSGYFDIDGRGMVDPKKEGWFTTEDKVIFCDGMIKEISREMNFVKIGGESVDMLRLQMIFERLKVERKIFADVVLVAVSDLRLGHCVHAFAAGGPSKDVQELVSAYDKAVFPYERIRRVEYVEKIPRSPLGKVIRM